MLILFPANQPPPLAVIFLVAQFTSFTNMELRKQPRAIEHQRKHVDVDGFLVRVITCNHTGKTGSMIRSLTAHGSRIVVLCSDHLGGKLELILLCNLIRINHFLIQGLLPVFGILCSLGPLLSKYELFHFAKTKIFMDVLQVVQRENMK